MDSNRRYISQLRRRSQGIIASDFLFLFGQLNFSSLSEETKEKVVEKTELIVTEAIDFLSTKNQIKVIKIDLNSIS